MLVLVLVLVLIILKLAQLHCKPPRKPPQSADALASASNRWDGNL
jgi:hypothetical protein